VLSFGYWCTNFLVVQRAMAAKNMTAARRTPLIAAVPKMLIPALVILPGMLAVTLAWTGKDGYRLPPKPIKSYAGIVAVVRDTSIQSLDPQAAFDKVAASVGMKLDQAKVAALLQDAPTLEARTLERRIQEAVVEIDYDGVILSLVQKYCPSGLLGLALTALLASFMSGMAGNVTAFNTVWTYDLYQAYIAPKKDDKHYLWMGRAITVVGILLSIACAYFASNYNNAMDVVQLVFGFVNAPLFATFLLGMFWARATGHGAFLGLLGGTLTSAAFHALTLATGNAPGIKGGYLGVVQAFPSEMAQNFWLASFAFLVCFFLTIGISLATARTKTDEDLKGLVYALTPKLPDDEKHWILRPSVLGVILLGFCVVLNVIFW
jgi:SSS family solute:Na+ symporter